MMSTVLRDSEKNMDFWYSSEKWKDVLEADEVETICVPLCLDVLKSWKRNDIDEALHLVSNILGQKGEAAFMQNFQELNLGGILVSGLESYELVASRAVPQEVIQKGEWDAIFFHQKRGIFVVEVKATEINDKDIVSRRIERAKTQLDRNIKNIKQSFHSLFQKEYTCITGFICFPFRNDDRDTYEGYRIIDKSALNDPALFRKFFEARANKTMTDVSLLQSFVAEFVCCRSQVEFHSQAYNAMQVATWIMEQDIAQKQDPKKLINMPENAPFGKIILTKQQLEIVECREKCITICGAPGSGKTLIVMLRALKATTENKPGSVFVFVNEKLKAKYKHFFFDEAKNICRRPKVHTMDMVKFAKPEDDVFFDETPVEDSYIEMVKIRMNCSGRTTVVFTGLYKPGEAVDSFYLYQPQLEHIRHFEMMKVLRGTESIFKLWKHYFPYDITIGHSIHGVAVKSVIFDSFEQVQNDIANKITYLTSTNLINIDLPALKREHIAVITCDDKDATDMKNYFKTKDIPCGQVNEQARKLKDNSVVAVDAYLSTPSYEWPVVFIVLKPGVTEEEVLPIAASRCIACLTIITYRKATASSIKADELEQTEEIFKNSNQAPPTSSFNSTSKSQTKDWHRKLKTAQQALKEMYLTRFKKVYPFSLPFTFDIENTWVSLALKEDEKSSQATEDHAQLLKKAFDKVKMLIIEGDPATGKTSLMRRLAYEWAKGKEEEKRKVKPIQRFANWVRGTLIAQRERKAMLLFYDLVLYAEFREVHEKKFQSIADMVLGGLEKYLESKDTEIIRLLLNDKQFCQQIHILVLLDGYDESSVEKQCLELNSYLTEKTINKLLFFNIVITTRKGPLSNCRDLKGRYIFAEVLGFTTRQQKEKYVCNHFFSNEIDNKHNIAAVHSLLNNNPNLNKLAETPLFLTFICLVHERIVDGTLVELYCNFIWWLINRHQQDFPHRDVPRSFGFQNGSSDRFETIQDHLLYFPQLHCLGKMALNNLEKDILEYSDYEKFNLQPIIEHSGLLRKERKHDNSLRLVSSFSFPHKTMKEFLAAFYCFCSNDPTSEFLLPNSELNLSKMNEFERFILRIALSDKMPIQPEKRKYYFEGITDIILDITFDSFNTTYGFNNKLLNWFLSQCACVRNIILNGKQTNEHARNMLDDIPSHNAPTLTSDISSPALFSFSEMMKLHSLTFWKCIFESNNQVSFSNCPSLKNVQFIRCELTSSANLGIAILPGIEIFSFEYCTFEANSQLSFTNYPSLNNLQFIRGGFKSSTNFGIAMLPAINTVEYDQCIFKANFHLSITNFPSVKNLKFKQCEMKSGTNLGIATLPAIDTVQFCECKIDLVTWHSVTDQISYSSVNCLKLEFGKDFNKEFLILLQKCNNVEKMEITIGHYKICQNDLLSFSDLLKLHSLTFLKCTFEAYTQLFFINCPLLKILKFKWCEMKRCTILGIETLLKIDSVEFDGCKADLVTWQSITEEIRKCSVKYLKLECGKDFNKEFLILLQKCNNVEKMEIAIGHYKICQNDLFSLSGLIKLHLMKFRACTFEATSQMFFTNSFSLKNLQFIGCGIQSGANIGCATSPTIDTVEFYHCTFEANSRLSITDCPSLKKLEFRKCEMKNNTYLDIASLSAFTIVGFNRCEIEMATWQSITDQITSSSIKCLKLSADYFAIGPNFDFLHYLHKCERIEEIHINDDLLNGDYIMTRYEEEVTANLAITALRLPRLRSMAILQAPGRRLDECKRLNKRNQERIEKSGQERNPEFSIKYEN